MPKCGIFAAMPLNSRALRKRGGRDLCGRKVVLEEKKKKEKKD
jgi:hypothetical protein